jgi:hypothetical protein
MKNIHVLRTDNYSPLVNSTNKYGGLFLSKYYSPTKDMGDSYQHIYITSDEEIKEGDYYISILENEVYKATKETQNIMSVANLIGTTSYKKTHFKIILTTDKDLIKDGVQSIGDEFLQWFVKNPSCEEVEVEVDLSKHNGKFQTKYGYKIIIQKEEPKQETIEEAINNFKKTDVYINEIKQKQERIYSEEEVKSILLKTDRFLRADLDIWFKQFEKK